MGVGTWGVEIKDVAIGDWVRFMSVEEKRVVIGVVQYLLDQEERTYFTVTDLGYVSSHMILELRSEK